MYQYTQSDEGFYTFESKHGVRYAVIFGKDEYIFPDLSEDVHVYEIMLMPVNSDKKQPRDRLIGLTVCRIVQDFIEAHQNRIVLYVCDNNDGRGMFRQLIFERWFNQYAEDPLTRKFSIKTENRYTSVILSENNPHFSNLIEAITYYTDNPAVLEEWLNSKEGN